MRIFLLVIALAGAVTAALVWDRLHFSPLQVPGTEPAEEGEAIPKAPTDRVVLLLGHPPGRTPPASPARPPSLPQPRPGPPATPLPRIGSGGALLTKPWHSLQLCASSPFTRRNKPLPCSVGRAPGPVSPATKGPSPRPSWRLNGVAKTESPSARTSSIPIEPASSAARISSRSGREG